MPVLARLPVLEEQKPLIESAALELATVYVLYGTQDAPRARFGGSRKAARLLAELRDQLFDVYNTIYTMPVEAHSAIGTERASAEEHRKKNEARGVHQISDRVPHPLNFAAGALALASAADSARLILIADPNPKRPGRPKKNAAIGITRRALYVYERLTGKRATVITKSYLNGHKSGGQFLEFLVDLFDALEIQASAEAQGRAAVTARKKRSK